MQKVAILCAFDAIAVKGKAGSDIFPEFAGDGVRAKSSINSGRGITIAEGIPKPLTTNCVVACCCINFAIFLMEQRQQNSEKFTQGECPVNWSKLLGSRALFAKDLLNEKTPGIDYRADTCDLIAEACRDIRKTFSKEERGLLILKSFNLIHLSDKEVRKMVKQGHWEDEIVKRIADNFNN